MFGGPARTFSRLSTGLHKNMSLQNRRTWTVPVRDLAYLPVCRLHTTPSRHDAKTVPSASDVQDDSIEDSA